MGRRRFENLDSEKQNRLFESAAAEFVERGFERASLNRILERSGMSKSSLYYYFDDKADLFASLAERSAALVFTEIGGLDPARLEAETYWSEIEALMRRTVAVMSRDVWYVKLARVVLGLRARQAQAQATGRLFSGARRFLGSVLARGQELGVVRDDLPQDMLIDCAMALGEAMDRWMVNHWDQMNDTARLDMVHADLALMRRLLDPVEKPS